MSIEPLTLVVLIVVVSIAGFVNGTIGLGYALLAVNALAIVVGAKDAVIVMSLITPVVSGLQAWYHRVHAPIWRRLWSLLVGAAVGNVIGTNLLIILPTAAISLALGAFTLWYVITALRAERPPMGGRAERRLAPIVGLVAGITNGAVGAAGPVLGAYLSAIGLRGQEFAFGISLVFFTMSLVRLGTLAVLGQYTSTLALAALVLIVPSIASQRVGLWLQARMPIRTLYRLVLVILGVASLNLIWRGLAGLLAA
jgi:uncharacterized membrane protein YfcA